MNTLISSDARVNDILVPSLRRLANSAADQIGYLQSIGTAPLADERALEFDDAVSLVQPLLDDGLLTSEQASALRLVDHQLQRMSAGNQKSLWNIEGLTSAPEWNEVRKLAAAALGTFSIPNMQA